MRPSVYMPAANLAVISVSLLRVKKINKIPEYCVSTPSKLIPAEPSAHYNLDRSTTWLPESRETKQKQHAYLVVPPICACPDLHSCFEVIRPTQKRIAHICEVNWGCLVETHDKDNDVPAGSIFATAREVCTEGRPILAVLHREDAHRSPCNLFSNDLNRANRYEQEPRTTSERGVSSASVTIAWMFRKMSRSVKRGWFASSRTSNQSG